MAHIYSKEPTVEEIIANNKFLLERAKDKMHNLIDVRNLVRRKLHEDPYKRSQAPDSRVYKEAAKRSLSVKDYWKPKPPGYKGNQMQYAKLKKDVKKLEHDEKHECDPEKKKKNRQKVQSQNHNNHGHEHEGLCMHALMQAERVMNPQAVKTDIGHKLK